MKSRLTFVALVLLIAGGILPQTIGAESRYRYVQYRTPRHRNYPGPAQPTNQVAKPAEPQDKPVKFKDLPMNAEFYFLADKDHKLFPRIKISATTARTVPTAAAPNVTTNPIPVETLVIAKKAGQKKDGDKKDQNGKRDKK